MAADLERDVAAHYARGDLEAAILDALAAAGKDIDRLAPDDLAPVDEFHSAGRQATADLVAQMGLSPGMHILDVGCGIGGTARFLAARHGCRVTGIDLTEDYVRTAEALTRRVGLAGRVTFGRASALALPFAAETFDGATMLHVGMNIADKRALFAAVRRVLKPGSVFAVYDVMRTGPGAPVYPLHWAATEATSFVAAPADYRAALADAGFAVQSERGRGAFALDAFRKAAARAAAGGLPPLGLHLLMRRDVGQKLANIIAGLEQGAIAPVEMIARAR